MKKQFFSSVICLFVIICFTSNLFYNVITSADQGTVEINSPAQEPDEFSQIQVDVPSLGTFLRADPNTNEGESIVQKPTIIDLEAEKIQGSKWISIRYSGEFFYSKNKKYSNGEITFIGLFSTTSELKSIENLKRVPGAINSGIDHKTDNTYIGNLATDISEDFIIIYSFESIIEIPNSARFLFLCIADIYYPDNSGSIQVTITKLEQYQVIFSIENMLLILEVAFIIFIVIYYKREKNVPLFCDIATYYT